MLRVAQAGVVAVVGLMAVLRWDGPRMDPAWAGASRDIPASAVTHQPNVQMDRKLNFSHLIDLKFVVQLQKKLNYQFSQFGWLCCMHAVAGSCLHCSILCIDL